MKLLADYLLSLVVLRFDLFLISLLKVPIMKRVVKVYNLFEKSSKHKEIL